MNYRTLAFIESSNDLTERANIVLREIDLAMVSMVDQETGLRGYLSGISGVSGCALLDGDEIGMVLDPENVLRA